MLENNKDNPNNLIVNKTKVVLSKTINIKNKVYSKSICFDKVVEVDEVVEVDKINLDKDGSDGNNGSNDSDVVNRSATTLLKRLYKSYRDTLLFSSLVIAIVLVVVGSSATVEEVNQVFVGVKPNMLKVGNKVANTTDNNNRNITANTSKSLAIKTDKSSWQAVDILLASTEKRRSRLFSQLGISKGEYVLACVSVHCGDCDDIALELNQKANVANLSNLSNIIAISSASMAEVEAWKNRLGLKFRVQSLSINSFDDSGAVILPTLIRVKDGKAIGVSESANVIN